VLCTCDLTNPIWYSLPPTRPPSTPALPDHPPIPQHTQAACLSRVAFLDSSPSPEAGATAVSHHHPGPCLAQLSSPAPPYPYHNQPRRTTLPLYTHRPYRHSLAPPSPSSSPHKIAPAVAICLSSGHSSLRNFQVLVPPAALSRRTRQHSIRLAIHPSSERQ
jgi:hypothetical protein